jgi:hypothetical protein
LEAECAPTYRLNFFLKAGIGTDVAQTKREIRSCMGECERNFATESARGSSHKGDLSDQIELREGHGSPQGTSTKEADVMES